MSDRLFGVQSPIPGIAPEIGGAPVSMPGGGDGTDRTGMTGAPVASASVAPPVSSGLAGAPRAGREVRSAQPPAAAATGVSASTEDDGGGSEAVPATDTDSAPAAPAQTDEERDRAEAVAGSDRQIKTIQDWMDAEENRPETPEQRRKRERKERSMKIVGAISDGLSALGNLFFTSQYAPDMYNHGKGSQLTATNDRIERLKAEREKKKEEYLKFALRLGDVENERARTVRDLEAKQEARRQAREKAEREAELHSLVKAIKEAEGRKAEQEAVSAQAEAEYAPQMAQAKLATEQARAGAQNASAAASRASAANSYASARAHDRSNAMEFTAWDAQGRPHPFRTEKAAEAFARQQGTYRWEYKREVTERVGELNDTVTTTMDKLTGFPVRPQKDEDNTPPSRRGSDDNKPPSRRN